MNLYFSPVAEFSPVMLRDEGLEDANIRLISSKVDLHRLADRNLWIMSDAIVELADYYEFDDVGGRRVCIGRFGQLCVSSK